MERSQSCANIDAAFNVDTDLCQTYELRQNQMNRDVSNEQQDITSNQPPHYHPPPSKPLRKKKLQRQQSALDNEDDMDLNYAADFEEEDEAYDQMPRLQTALQQKQLQFRQRKPQSEPALMRHISNSSSGSSSSCSSNSNSTSTSYTSTSTKATSALRQLKHEESFDSLTSNTTDMSPLAQRHNFGMLIRDNSVQSDSSRYSSVDSLLESRKPDPETILINLGFGPIGSEDILSRIPKRFLKPSQVRGIDTEAFVKRLQLASSLADHSVLGYRGLTGNPDVPPSSIVAKIMERFEVNDRKKSMGSIEHTIR